MGLKVNIAVFVVTVLMTITTTGLMSLAIVTEHWEIIQYDPERIKEIVAIKGNNEFQGVNVSSHISGRATTEQEINRFERMNNRLNHLKLPSVEVLYNGKVVLVKNRNQTVEEVMIQMHAGLWAVCYDVKGILHAYVCSQTYF